MKPTLLITINKGKVKYRKLHKSYTILQLKSNSAGKAHCQVTVGLLPKADPHTAGHSLAIPEHGGCGRAR